MGWRLASRCASISVDFESMYYYAETLGLPHPDRDEPYDRIVRRFLKFFASLDVRATFFLVGRDIETGKLSPALLREIAGAGHELANHTLSHPYNFASLDRPRKLEEILGLQRLVESATGQRVVGFRAPCFDIDETILTVLREQGYSYDSSVYPCSLKSLQELGYALMCRGKFRNTGSWKNAFAPGIPYRPGLRLQRRGDGDLVEVLIATTPGLRLPFYSTIHFALNNAAFDALYAMLRLRRPFFTYELHSIDLADRDEDQLGVRYPGIERHPCMRRPWREKAELLRYMVARFRENYELVTMRELVERMKTHESLLVAAR